HGGPVVKAGKSSLLLLAGLGLFHIAILLAGFIAPYDVEQQDRDLAYAPPTRLHFLDAKGRLHVMPFICALETRDDLADGYAEDCDRVFPVHIFVNGAQYKLAWLCAARTHLFGVDAPAKLRLMGTDAFGRDVFSRFVYGGQVSLFAGLLATLLSVTFGTSLGL